jgi:hypothetical protein
MALFLVGGDNVVFSVAIWQLWQTGARGLAAAAALLLIVMIGGRRNHHGLGQSARRGDQGRMAVAFASRPAK